MHQESANAPGKVRSEPPLQKAPARPEPAHKALTCVPPSRVSEEEWAAFCEEVEHVNRDPRYIGQTNVYKIVPRHYAAVLANVLTNEPRRIFEALAAEFAAGAHRAAHSQPGVRERVPCGDRDPEWSLHAHSLQPLLQVHAAPTPSSSTSPRASKARTAAPRS